MGFMEQHRVDLVIPVYNEAKGLPSLLEAIGKSCQGNEYKFRFIFVDDGSTDESLQTLLSHQAKDPQISIIELSRNFGHQAAITTGLKHSKADFAYLSLMHSVFFTSLRYRAPLEPFICFFASYGLMRMLFQKEAAIHKV